MKRFVALARVSSAQQEREGVSLAIQEQALREYVARCGGELDRFWRIAETASKRQERDTFRELIAYVRANHRRLSGMLFYKVDRAARNLPDYVTLEQIERELGVPFIAISQATEDNPAGRMMRRSLANFASYYTEQLSIDVREALHRRVRDGWFATSVPYGYTTTRREGRSVVVVEPREAAVVRRIYDLYANHRCTLDMVVERLAREGHFFTAGRPRWWRTRVHAVLTSRAYLGEIEHRGQWHPGRHEPIVDRATFAKVAALLGGRYNRAHELAYAACAVACGHCGRPVTGERITRRRKPGPDRPAREDVYTYYRCARYNEAGHPRVRVTERDLDEQVLAMFGRIRIVDEPLREWFREVIGLHAREGQRQARAQAERIDAQIRALRGQQDALLNLRIAGEIDEDTFARKRSELAERDADLATARAACERGRDEDAEVIASAFELSQDLQRRWVTADVAEKRKILELVCLNMTLRGVSLEVTMRSPFAELAQRAESVESALNGTAIEQFVGGVGGWGDVERGVLREILRGAAA